MTGVEWPNEKDGKWTVEVQSADRAGTSVSVVDANGLAAIEPHVAPPPETTARLMRRLHDGTRTGLVWQMIVFLSGLIPAILAVTGIIMWVRTRKWRGRGPKIRAGLKRWPYSRAGRSTALLYRASNTRA